MLSTQKLATTEIDTERPRTEHTIVDLMRVAIDGSGSFMSRRARQILWDRFRIAVVLCAGIYTVKAQHLLAIMDANKGMVGGA